MAKYTEEQMLAYRAAAVAPAPVVMDAFNAMVEEVRELQAAAERANARLTNGDLWMDDQGHEHRYYTATRRRALRSLQLELGPRKPKVVLAQTDADGWTTLAVKKGEGEDAAGERDEFRTRVELLLKPRPNSKNILSSKPADPRDVVADKPAKAFNAFDALMSESESESE